MPSRILASAALLAAGLAADPARAGLCGDIGGDGFFTASDALVTLKAAVEGGYDRRADVHPKPAGNGVLSASDALESLKATVEGRIPPCRGWTATRAVVGTAPDGFSSGFGGLAVVDIASRSFVFRAASISGDSVVRAPAGVPVVVNRQGTNSLQLLDTSKPSLPNIKECSVSDGINSNPQDVVFVSPAKGYVTPYASSELLVIAPPVLFDPGVDPACNGIISGRIDLSDFDDDGIPQMDQMVLVGNDLFVSLQLLGDAGGFQPKQNGILVVLDTVTDTVKGSIPLGFANPFAQTKGLVWDEFQQRIFVGGPGTTGNQFDDGGIESIDPVAMESAGLLLSGADIEANIFDFVIAGTARAFAIIVDRFSNSVVEISLASRTVTRTLLTSENLITDIEMTETGELWVAYRGVTPQDPPGIRVFDVRAEPTEILSARTTLAQPPFTLAFVD